MTCTFVFSLLMYQPAKAVVAVAHPEKTETADKKSAKEAVKAYKELSRKERRAFRKDLRKKLKKELKKKRRGASDLDTTLIIIITILIPPLGVYLYEDDITTRFWISLILTLLFYFPGLIYSLLVVLGAI